MNLNVSLDMSAVEQFSTLLPRHIENAQKSAVRTTITFIRAETERQLSTRAGVPRKFLKQYRVKGRTQGGAGRLEKGIVWIGYNSIASRYFGKLDQTESGAFAGSYYFERAFVARMPRGMVSVFKRVGTKRLPITEQKVELPQTAEISATLQQRAQDEVYRRFVAKLRQYETRLANA